MFQVTVSLGLMLGVAWLDYLTGTELAFSIFYLAPIALVSWFSGRPVGVGFAVAAALLWWGAEVLDNKVYSTPQIAYWNTAVRLGFFLIVNQLVGTVRRELTRVRDLSQRDHLTGAANRRYFTELAEQEMARANRYERSVSLGYIDLDNFKTVNDTMGHEVGDQVLTSVVSALNKDLRRLDLVARIGGDEFLILMPETDLEQARKVMERQLEQCCKLMADRSWPIGLSIGVASCRGEIEVEQLIKRADAQMYRAKESGKNRVCFEVNDLVVPNRG